MTAETWNAWFDRFKAEKALAKAKALSATDFKQKLRQVRRPPGSEFERLGPLAGQGSMAGNVDGSAQCR